MKQIILCVTTLLLLGGCASNYKVKEESSKNSILTEVPKWFIDKKKTSGLLKNKEPDRYIYGVGSAVSASLQIAVDKANMQAKADLADQIRSYVNKNVKYVAEETGSETSNSLNTATQTDTDNIIRNINVTGYEEWKKGVFVTSAQQYRVYVGLKWTRGEKNVLNDLIPMDLLVRQSESISSSSE